MYKHCLWRHRHHDEEAKILCRLASGELEAVQVATLQFSSVAHSQNLVNPQGKRRETFEITLPLSRPPLGRPKFWASKAAWVGFLRLGTSWPGL